MSEVTAEMIERGRGVDPAVAAKRRHLAQEVRANRERLTSAGAGHHVFDVELLRLFAQSRTGASMAMVILAISVSALACRWVEPRYVLLWMSLVCASLALSYGLSRKLLALSKSDIQVRSWERRFAVVEMIQGTLWALIVILLLHEQDVAARTFVLFVLLIVAAMTAMVSAAIPLAVYCGLFPVAIAVMAYVAPENRPQDLVISLMAGGAQLYFIVLARRLYSTSRDTLSLSKEKEALIAELEQAKANSDEARRRAEEASLAKSRFLATMSHELRTPLNAILGFSEVMKSELFGQHSVQAYRDYSNDIHSSGEHLLTLINEILDLSRVEAGRYELKEESVSLVHIVEDCCHLLSLRAGNRAIAINTAVEPALPRIWADERAVRQIVLNLLTNAIKFTPRGGSVTIKVGWTALGGQYMAIRDTGTGIPPEEMPVIMSSFGRGSLAQKNADEGSGLGLPIVKGLVELHGGTFSIKSEVRVGTEVVVVFPPERVMDTLPLLDPNAPVVQPAPIPKISARAA